MLVDVLAERLEQTSSELEAAEPDAGHSPSTSRLARIASLPSKRP
jgi:hypothetical protein